ncbi:hypothetical protein B0H10DRAFT_1108767 [Mycena sp. CBHHK59/15]|nr:hypothetical protein B0H10DRAFT_1108767 [Mycena sp. CBHHK59/15]
MDLSSVPIGASQFEHFISSNIPPSDAEASELRQILEDNRKAIAELDAEISPLIAKRNGLSRSTNTLALLLSSTRTVPFEIIAQIFLGLPVFAVPVAGTAVVSTGVQQPYPSRYRPVAR